LNSQDTSSLLKITAGTGILGSSREVSIGLSLPFAELIKPIQEHACSQGKSNQQAYPDSFFGHAHRKCKKVS
jgi:hypothetical protein